MAKAQAVDEQCPVEVGLNILSGKWKLKILWHLSSGTIRFNELQRLLGKHHYKNIDATASGIRGTGNYCPKSVPRNPA